MKKRYEHFYVLLYNDISEDDCRDWCEIPESARMVLMYFDYEQIITPYVVEDFARGMSRRQISNKYGISPSMARSIGRKFGFVK
jgi:hypothetical protein